VKNRFQNLPFKFQLAALQRARTSSRTSAKLKPPPLPPPLPPLPLKLPPPPPPPPLRWGCTTYSKTAK
jgi:hypothetical protein